MSVHSFKTVQVIPIPLSEAWSFFSNPANLQAITPAAMKFEVISKFHGEKMYPGQIIEYTIRPLLGIPVYWMTEITQVAEGSFFIDEQRYGPYSLWHHQHHFKDLGNAVEMTDIVHYKVPLGWLGDVVDKLYVKNQLKEIFDFRFEEIRKKFGS
ncbi:MAG: SRPBCC family protein [Chitinophagaceae bacterium]|nr:SRPBCC family protein [Chitinophagaceae bacterium]